MKVKVPPIKSQGIKTKLVQWIGSFVPSDFSGRWIEPFSGTGVVGFNLAHNEAFLCDTNPHLVNFYQAVKDNVVTSHSVSRYLKEEGEKLKEIGQDHFYYIRDRFNKEHNPFDFLFLNRAGFNGMIRFNRSGGLNVPFCRKPNRFDKSYITKIVNQVDFVSKVIQLKNFSFKCQSFEKTISIAGVDDIVYCDPPYIGRYADYYNGWDESQEKMLFDCLSKVACKFILSTWHHNDYRKNPFIESLWSTFNIATREHFYHVGGKEKNRNPMIEAVVSNFDLPESSSTGFMKKNEESKLFEFASDLS